MLSLKNIEKILASGKPVVWTMHDMWPCTGICHHARECTHYQQECHNCPFIHGGGGKRDLSYRIFHKKQALYQQPSHQLRHLQPLAGRTCPDKRPLQRTCRDHASPTPSTPISSSPATSRKPAAELPAAARQETHSVRLGEDYGQTERHRLPDRIVPTAGREASGTPEDQLGVVVFGNQSQQLQNLLPFKVYPLNFVSNEHQLVNIYNAVDIFVTPSLEENLPNTIMEAMACGIPCVGFNVGGIPEMIDHLHNGYVAQYKSSEDFANGIYWTLTEPDYPSLSEQACRKAISNYSESVVAKKYIDLYNKVTGRNA